MTKPLIECKQDTNIKGTIPSAARMPILNALLMNKNAISGTFPQQLFDYSNQTVTVITSGNRCAQHNHRNWFELCCRISGTLPNTVWPQTMQYFIANAMFLSGSLPEFLPKPLQVLSISRNYLRGAI